MICPECKDLNPDGSRFCESCGFSFESVNPSATDSIADQRTISWETRIGLLTNPLILKQTALTVALAGFLMALLLSFIFVAAGEYDGIIPMLRVTLIVTLVLGLAIVLIMLIFLGNRIHVRFTVNDEGILWETVDKRIRAANRMAVIAGGFGRSPQTVGAGVIGASREKEFIPWYDIAELDVNHKRLQIVFRNSWRPVMLAVCNPENFQTVLAYITERVRSSAKNGKSERKLLAKPVIRGLLRSIAVNIAAIPLVVLTEPMELNILVLLLIYCFALAMVWLFPLFGWVVIGSLLVFAVQLTITGIDEFVYLYNYEKAFFILAYPAMIFLAWFSWGAIRGRYLPPMFED